MFSQKRKGQYQEFALFRLFLYWIMNIIIDYTQDGYKISDSVQSDRVYQVLCKISQCNKIFEWNGLLDAIGKF